MSTSSPTAARQPRPPVLPEAEARGRALEAATRLYYGRGISAVGMDALSSESGIGLKRLYQLFPSKEAIVEEVLNSMHETWVTDLEQAAASASTARDRLLAVYDYLGRWFSDDDYRGCVFINTFGEMGAVSPRIATLVRDHKRDFQQYVVRLAVEAGAPEALGQQLAILAEGAQTTAAIAGDPAAAGYARDAAVTLIDAALS